MSSRLRTVWSEMERGLRKDEMLESGKTDSEKAHTTRE